MRYSNNGKINVPLYLLGGGLLVLATSLVLYLVNKTVNVGFIILGGILVLFRVNKERKENFTILGILCLIGIISGIILDIFM